MSEMFKLQNCKPDSKNTELLLGGILGSIPRTYVNRQLILDTKLNTKLWAVLGVESQNVSQEANFYARLHVARFIQIPYLLRVILMWSVTNTQSHFGCYSKMVSSVKGGL